MVMNLQACLFDLDGTLLDTLDDLADSMNAVLEQNGFPAHATNAYRHFVGDGIAEMARRVLPPGNRSSSEIERTVVAMEQEYERRMMNRSRPYPGILTMLDVLTEGKVPLAILSNKPDEPVQVLVDSLLGPRPYAFVSGVCAGIARKPDPGGALVAAEALGVSPGQVLYAGDTATDMCTALAAGMVPVGVLWGFRARKELEEAGARHIIAHPRELIALLML